MTLTYAELFAGAGGMSLGLEAGGFHAAAHAEIEPNARAVLRHRWPGVRLDGDVSKISGADYAGISLLSGGSPCQDLSVAGRRAGLTGSRSSLFHEQHRIWMESGAPYFLWENVYGAFSSNAGHDFATVLSTIVGRDLVADGAVRPDRTGKIKWLRAGRAVGPSGVVAWRVLDLQHFGPPQRRVRVFVLAARTGGIDPAEVLALRESGCGHPAPRHQAQERITRGTPHGTASDQVTAVSHTVTTKWAKGTGGFAGINECNNLVCQTYSTPAIGDIREDDVTSTITKHSGGGGETQNPAFVVQRPIVARMVAFGEYAEDGTASAIKARDYKDATDLVYGIARPRRLTPVECERLMSWPDQWTLTGQKEDGTVFTLSDTARYRLCGNGVGSVCAEWIARRLHDALQRQEDA